jgi:hypothetical protein
VPAGAPVRVWDVKEVRFVQQSETGEGGAYRLPALAPGSYQAVFADRLRVPVVVSEAEGEEPAVFNVVIPRGTAAFARMPIEQKAVILSVMTEKWAGGDLSEQTAEADDDDEDQILVGLLPAIIGIGAGSCCAKVCITQDWCGLDDDDDDRGRRLPVSP